MNPFKLKKELLKKTEIELNNGSTKNNIYTTLLNEDKLHNKVLLDTVSFYVSKEKRIKFHFANRILFFLLIASLLLTIPLYSQFFSNVNIHVISIISMILLLFIHIQLIYGIHKWSGKIYKSIIIIKVLWLIGFFVESNNGYYSSWLFIYPVILVAEIILSYWQYKKLFPNYNWKGPKTINNKLEFDI